MFYVKAQKDIGRENGHMITEVWWLSPRELHKNAVPLLRSDLMAVLASEQFNVLENKGFHIEITTGYFTP